MIGERIVIRKPFDAIVEKHEILPINEDQFLVKAKITGISAGTERMRYNGTNPAYATGRRKFPEYPGYEFVGEVVKTGKNVQGIEVGDQVCTTHPHARYAILDKNKPFFILPKDMPAEKAIFAPLIMTCLHAHHLSKAQLGDDIAIVGFGVVGYLMAAIAKISGASHVGISTRDYQKKKNLIMQAGAEPVNEHSNYRGYDTVFECAGVPITIQQSAALVRKRGQIVIVGFHTQDITISGEHLFTKEINIQSIRAGGGPDYSYEYVRWSAKENFHLASKLLTRINTTDLITHKCSPEDINDVYQLIDKSSDFTQVVIDWS